MEMETQFLEPNHKRGAWGLFATALVGLGSGLLWGWGGAVLAVGMLMWLDIMCDEAIERITLITKWPKT